MCKACGRISYSSAELERQSNPGCIYCGADKDQMEETIINSDTCVCCGDYVPEGRMVCFQCENDPQYALKKEDEYGKG
jgi:hypothetical protein